MSICAHDQGAEESMDNYLWLVYAHVIALALQHDRKTSWSSMKMRLRSWGANWERRRQLLNVPGRTWMRY